MKLPWVARSTLDMAQHNLAEMRRMYGELFAMYHELAKPVHPVTFTTSLSTPLTAAPAERRPNVVAQAIREEAGSDVRLQAYFRRRAAELRGEGLKDDEIAAKLHQWEQAGGADPRKSDVGDGTGDSGNGLH